MDAEELEKWRRAGTLAAQALEYGKGIIKKGASMREVCDLVDKKIVDIGGTPAWPTQIGNNHVAAHFTPDPDDNTLFDTELVCLDVGVHVDGYVGDNAVTVDLSGQWKELVQASKEALAAASKLLAPGISLGEIGRTIQEVIVSHGFSPVRNLCGHGISRFVIHDKPSVPNYATGNKEEIQEGQIIAIEPFASTGAGIVQEASQCNLFSLIRPKPIRSASAREALGIIQQSYGPLPFTTRWLSSRMGLGKAKLAIRELLQAQALHSYPPLADVAQGFVSVEEKTFYIGEKLETLTKL